MRELIMTQRRALVGAARTVLERGLHVTRGARVEHRDMRSGRYLR